MMKTSTLIGVALLTLVGCNSRVPPVGSRAGSPVGLFNHEIIFESTEGLPQVIGDSPNAWSPADIAIDEYGALVRYDKAGSFEDLRSAINVKFSDHELDDFADDPEMGLWRIEKPGFAIQLTEDEDYFTVAYVRFIDELTMADKLEEFATNNPDLVEEFNWQCFVNGLREVDDASPEPSRAPMDGLRGSTNRKSFVRPL